MPDGSMIAVQWACDCHGTAPGCSSSSGKGMQAASCIGWRMTHAQSGCSCPTCVAVDEGSLEAGCSEAPPTQVDDSAGFTLQVQQQGGAQYMAAAERGMVTSAMRWLDRSACNIAEFSPERTDDAQVAWASGS